MLGKRDDHPTVEMKPTTTRATEPKRQRVGERVEESTGQSEPDEVLPVPRISNVVSTFKSGDKNKKLNLMRFSQVYGFEFQPSRFAACSIRIRDKNCKGRSTALAFTSGKFVITGCRSEAESLLFSRRYIHMLNRLGERLSFKDFITQNIVSSVDLKVPLQLHLMQASNTSEMAWENRKFPGLIWRDGKSKLVLLCFRSGRIILTGAKSRKQIDREWGRLYNIIMKFTDNAPGATKCSRDYAANLRRQEEKMPFLNESLFDSDNAFQF